MGAHSLVADTAGQVGGCQKRAVVVALASGILGVPSHRLQLTIMIHAVACITQLMMCTWEVWRAPKKAK